MKPTKRYQGGLLRSQVTPLQGNLVDAGLSAVQFNVILGQERTNGKSHSFKLLVHSYFAMCLEMKRRQAY